MQRFGARSNYCSYYNIIWTHRQQQHSLVNHARRKVLIKSMNTSLNTEISTDNNKSNNNNVNGSRSVKTKDIWIIRHGQAMHNPRAEYARDVLQCSHEEFLSIMEQDDCFDAPLTDLGQQQAQQIYHQYGISHWGVNTSKQHPFVAARTVNGGDNVDVASASSIISSKRHNIELIVSSPLSRALKTAELALGDANHHNYDNIYNKKLDNVPTTLFPTTTATTTNRVCYEGFREINGWLQNGKRRTQLELQEQFPSWDFSLLSSNVDNQWTPTLETTESCMERGYNGLLWIMNERIEQSIILVAHGALLKYTLTDHPNVILRDERNHETPSPLSPLNSHNSNQEIVAEEQQPQQKQQHLRRCVRKRYHNCELRRYRMELLPLKQNEEESAAGNNSDTPSNAAVTNNNRQRQERDVIILTEVDL